MNDEGAEKELAARPEPGRRTDYFEERGQPGLPAPVAKTMPETASSTNALTNAVARTSSMMRNHAVGEK